MARIIQQKIKQSEENITAQSRDYGSKLAFFWRNTALANGNNDETKRLWDFNPRSYAMKRNQMIKDLN